MQAMTMRGRGNADSSSHVPQLEELINAFASVDPKSIPFDVYLHVAGRRHGRLELQYLRFELLQLLQAEIRDLTPP
jgi:hypothetical protein